MSAPRASKLLAFLAALAASLPLSAQPPILSCCSAGSGGSSGPPFDNIGISGNTISSTDTNGSISLVPNGTGVIQLGSLSASGQLIRFGTASADNNFPGIYLYKVGSQFLLDFNAAGDGSMLVPRAAGFDYVSSHSASPGLRVESNGNISMSSAGSILVSASSDATSTKDVGVRRISAGTWQDTDGGIGGGWRQWAGQCFVASDQTNSTTTFASTTCSITVKASTKYAFKCEFFLSDSVAAEGAKIDFNGGTATATTFRAQTTAFDTALNLSTQTTSLAGSASASTFTGSGAFEVHGALVSNAAGTFIPRFAQASHATGTLTLFTGSHCLMWSMP